MILAERVLSAGFDASKESKDVNYTIEKALYETSNTNLEFSELTEFQICLFFNSLRHQGNSRLVFFLRKVSSIRFWTGEFLLLVTFLPLQKTIFFSLRSFPIASPVSRAREKLRESQGLAIMVKNYSGPRKPTQDNLFRNWISPRPNPSLFSSIFFPTNLTENSFPKMATCSAVWQYTRDLG